MSEYWVSKKQYWCQYCKIFIRDDAPQAAITHQNAANASASISAAPTTGSASPASSAAPAKGKLAAGQPVNTDKYANYSTAASLGYVDADAILAERAKLEREERAKVGQAGTWETVAVIAPPNVAEEDVGEEDPRYAFNASGEHGKHQLAGLLRGSLDEDPSEEARNFRFETDRQPGESSDRPRRVKPDVYDDGEWDPDSILKLGKKTKREASASGDVGADTKGKVKDETSHDQQGITQGGEAVKSESTSDARAGAEIDGQAPAVAASLSVKEEETEAKPTGGGMFKKRKAPGAANRSVRQKM
ncbi:hypothetical protein QFC24_001719 [Naganishia onofrii]|uniref:Uncharacterized protein n=1 Tax=Naganishia onofrii TaxID=1851511 RepID=A0ACC2XTI7_9TREE|nr:hypothetical protein QFC24_001719 [Naganishia onofrii]